MFTILRQFSLPFQNELRSLTFSKISLRCSRRNSTKCQKNKFTFQNLTRTFYQILYPQFYSANIPTATSNYTYIVRKHNLTSPNISRQMKPVFLGWKWVISRVWQISKNTVISRVWHFEMAKNAIFRNRFWIVLALFADNFVIKLFFASRLFVWGVCRHFSSRN